VSTDVERRTCWARRGLVGLTKDGSRWKAEWRLGAVARGGVLFREGIGGDISELRELRGGEREMRAASIEEKGVADGGLTVRRRGQWLYLTETSEVGIS
jgi:hypothetical protein